MNRLIIEFHSINTHMPINNNVCLSCVYIENEKVKNKQKNNTLSLYNIQYGDEMEIMMMMVIEW